MTVPNLDSSSEFAYHVIPQLREIASELAKETGIKPFCSWLAAALNESQNRLETAREDRLLKLLDNFERLCRWPSRANSPSLLYKSFDRKRYPTLSRVSTKKAMIKNALRAFAADPQNTKDRTTLVKLVEKFCGPREVQPGLERGDLVQATIQQQHDDYQAHIRALYNSLACNCFCPREDGRKPITVNLSLNSCCTPGDLANSVNFRLFFLDHPHDRGVDGACQWQDAQVCVLRTRGIKWETDQDCLFQTQSGTQISIETFCEIITNRNRSQIKLAVLDDNNGLVFQGPGELSKDFLLGVSSVSLAELLDGAKLTQRMRLLLSYILAKAFWQFYDSKWMQAEWTKETFHFMFQQKSNVPKGILISEPFLSTQFDKNHASGAVKDLFRVHSFPKILALGIMLLEIELGIKIEEHRTPDLGVNADHIAATEVFNTTDWNDGTTFDPVKDVIGACLMPNDFIPFVDDVHGLRNSLEKSTVNQLQAMYTSAWGDPDTATVRAIELSPSVPPTLEAPALITHPPSPTPSPLPSLPPASSPSSAHNLPYLLPAMAIAHHVPFQSFYLPVRSASSTLSKSLQDGTMLANKLGPSSDDWFQELDKLNYVLNPKRDDKDNGYKRVKIAILDTGVGEEYEDQVKDYKDFVSQDDINWRDNTGHGTNAVRLISRVYRLAEIYVGRIFEGSFATAQTTKLMTNAIRHARETWKVDIIVMPSGFKSNDVGLEEAVDEAYSSKILMFAAASNYGNITDIAFPGRLYVHLKLFCMFSTDVMVRALPHFNPTVSSAARHSFAILGEDIVLPGEDEVLSGTSYATMIGAAIAARLLDFSRHKENRERIRRINKLHTIEGMSAVFEKMVKGAADNGYHCMAPWKILRQDAREEEPSAKRLSERAHICETISRALEEMNWS